MWLGIDIGTGGSRALLIDDAGEVRAGCTAPHDDMIMQRPLWAEQHPENWWDAAVAAIRGVLAEARVAGREVRGVGLSGQMHGLVLLDGAGAVIRPSLIWCDQRSQRQVDGVNAKIGREKVLEYIANPVLTGFTLPKLLWVRDNEPVNFDRAQKMLLPKDYIRYRLTGEYATEVSDASGTAVFDVVKRRWSFEMMDGLGLDRGLLPECRESVEVSGRITPQVAELTGLAAGTPVVGGGGDQASSAVGNGIVEPGIVSCTLGTSGVVFAHMEKVAYDAAGRVHTFCHAVPGKWHVMGVTQGAGLSLQWFRNQLAPGAAYDALMAEAAQAPAGAQGLFWLPYLMGERTPHLDALARGGWIGLTASHDRRYLVRSVMEGVAFSLKDCFAIIREQGLQLDQMRATGGGAKSPLWRQIIADVLGVELVLTNATEGPAFGAALLAGVASGVYASVQEACRQTVRVVERTEPDARPAAAYAHAYERYRMLYPALRPIISRPA